MAVYRVGKIVVSEEEGKIAVQVGERGTQLLFFTVKNVH